jgi:hypothetical protein
MIMQKSRNSSPPICSETINKFRVLSEFLICDFSTTASRDKCIKNY